jgi:hypothetical protein
VTLFSSEWIVLSQLSEVERGAVTAKQKGASRNQSSRRT